ncbi:multidrug resistance protein fnx1 [Hypoxylon argillaceum]|nr:multidrug resistance protein fnx1 [Hypoxylon argillaceum]
MSADVEKGTTHRSLSPEPNPQPQESPDSNQAEIIGQGNNESTAEPTARVEGAPAPKSFGFWAIIVSLCVTGLLSALENTVVVTSLPTIVEDLQLGQNYIWVTNIFFLTSGICGGATSGTMLITGRAVQGIGSRGINMIINVIISNLVPLRERGNYISIILTVYAVGTSLGPFVGGILVERSSWRWVFYINLPVGGVALILLFLFLRLKMRKGMTFVEKVKRIDFIGNAILIAATVSTLQMLGSGLAKEPVTPLPLFTHRTGAIVAFNTFMNSILLYWVTFSLPVYFQAVLLSTPSWSGVQLLPVVLVAVPGAVIAVIVLSKFGKYKALHLAGFAIETLSIGLFSTLDRSSSTAEWVISQLLAGLGSGMILNTLLPALQAGIPERDQASATASWAFIRSFGNVWGVAIPAAIFANQFQANSFRISTPAIVAQLEGAQAYEHATKSFIESLQDPVRSELISAYVQALHYVWYVAIVFCGFATVLAIFEDEIPLRKELETEYGMKETDKGLQADRSPSVST